MQSRAQVRYNVKGELVYPAASLTVVYNKPDDKQSFVSAHTDTVTCMAMHPDGELWGGATNNRILKFKFCIHPTHTHTPTHAQTPTYL